MLASASVNWCKCKYRSFILRVLEHDWLDKMIINDVIMESSILAELMLKLSYLKHR